MVAKFSLRECGITLNRNALPFDPNGPWYTSGLRVGTPAVTTLGLGADDMREIAAIMKRVLAGTQPTTTKDGTPSKAKYRLDDGIDEEARGRVRKLLDRYPCYPQIDLDLLLASIGEA